MRKWSFVVELENLENLGGLRDIIKRRAEEVVAALGKVDSGKAIYAVRVTFYQKKERWLRNNHLIPREDWGIDLDNFLRQVFNGLGPIIGNRRDHINEGPGGALDGSITEVRAQKVNNCSDKEFLGVEVELLHVSEANE